MSVTLRRHFVVGTNVSVTMTTENSPNTSV